MNLAARAETWLRVCAGKLVGPPAPFGDEVDRHGFLVLSSVAHALGVLEVLDSVAIDAVFADLAIAAGVRGRKVAPNVFRSGEGLAYQSPAPSAGTSEPWPPRTFDAGACLQVGEAVVQVLWLTRTPVGTWAPLRVRLPTSTGARPATPAATAPSGPPVVPLGPGVPVVELIDEAGGAHHWSWLSAQGDGRSSWGTAHLVPDLPPDARCVRHRVAGQDQEVTVAMRPPRPALIGRCEDDGRSPGERFVERLGSRGWSGVSAPVDNAAASVREETCAALRDLGLVGRGYRTLPASAATEQAQRIGAGGVQVPAVARAVGEMLPLQTAVFVEGMTLDADRVVVHVRQQVAPTPARVVWWQAVDGSGATWETEVLGGSHGGLPGFAGVAIRLRDGEEPRELRLVASTPFESAYLEIEIP